jgi:hypothetical protein
MKILYVLVTVCLVSAILVSGCTTEPLYPPNSHTNVTVHGVTGKNWVAIEGAATFSCYLQDENDVVYKVVHENDCKRFRENIGTNYSVTQDHDQKIVYAERIVDPTPIPSLAIVSAGDATVVELDMQEKI